MKLIVGLGNPGEKYANVRHNLGFMVVDELVKKLDVGSGKLDFEVRSWKFENKFKSEILRFAQNDKGGVMLVKPQTYMNNSGLAVKLLTTYYNLQPVDIIVIHDELDLPLGKIKVRMGGAAAGHHGVESIIKALDTDQFIRVRLGIGNIKTQLAERKREHVNAEKFVLEPFMHSEKSQVKHMLKQAIKALDLLLAKDLTTAQNQFN
ncbi:aminoacyl-tRNA hydrolase [Candidatus Daviesbacteria bacterium]|nr:aminoacyl-tRNA hydrolase [Candidatus Daviesbacteria bacterium]